MNYTFVTGLVVFLVPAILTFSYSLIAKVVGVSNNDIYIQSAVILSVLILILHFAREKIQIFVLNRLIIFTFGMIRNRIGFERFYDNFKSASDDIVADFCEATNVKIFVQLGRGIIGGQNSLLFDHIRVKNNNDFDMRVLYASIESEWLSKERAEKRGSSYAEWEAETNHNKKYTSILKKENVNILSYSHTEPYLWRLIFIDDSVYFLPYLFKKENEKYAPVIKFVNNGSGGPSLYDVFLRYFETVFQKNEVSS
jgi:hypothetical protein